MTTLFWYALLFILVWGAYKFLAMCVRMALKADSDLQRALELTVCAHEHIETMMVYPQGLEMDVCTSCGTGWHYDEMDTVTIYEGIVLDG